MCATSSTLIIPVENQVREFDAKLLLSCLAAERGFPVLLGSRAYVHYIAGTVPRGVYLAKSMRALSQTMFKLLRALGHDIVAWEEEALVHPPQDTYFTLRLSPGTIDKVSHVFAWGQDNLDLLKNYPHLPEGLPLHLTGNPRGDMLRPELRAYFDGEVAKLHAQYGRFVLINTNYSDVNPFIPDIGLFAPGNGTASRRGQAGIGMSEAFASGLRDHKEMLFREFQAMVAQLAQAFPDLTIVIRPHPSEKFDSYLSLAKGCDRVHVDASGNIIPWLLAARAMIHNGCTTGVEAYALRRPALAYLPGLNALYDFDFQGLPNRLSHQCRSFEELVDALQSVLEGSVGAAGGAERETLASHYLAARDGALACERILDVLVDNGYCEALPSPPPRMRATVARALTALRARRKQSQYQRADAGRQNYHDHRFPELGVAEVGARIAALGRTLGRFDRVEVRSHSKHVFSIACR